MWWWWDYFQKPEWWHAYINVLQAQGFGSTNLEGEKCSQGSRLKYRCIMQTRLIHRLLTGTFALAQHTLFTKEDNGEWVLITFEFDVRFGKYNFFKKYTFLFPRDSATFQTLPNFPWHLRASIVLRKLSNHWQIRTKSGLQLISFSVLAQNSMS